MTAPTVPDLAAIESVTEWARQWRLNPNIDRSGTIYSVWFDPESSAIELNLNDIEALLALVREQSAKLDAVAELVQDLTDPEECSFDHHGGCQAHGYLSLQPGETCPQHAAKEWTHAALTVTGADQ
jgi:hypothetical protein